MLNRTQRLWKLAKPGVAALLLAAAICACSIVEPSPPQITPFLTHADLLKPAPKRAPYQLVWTIREADPSFKPKPYTHVYLKPVNLAYLGGGSARKWHSSLQVMPATPQEVREIADLLYADLLQSLTDSGHNWRVASGVGPGVLVVEAALVELYPTQISYNVAGAAAGMFVPGGSTISAAGKGSIGLELKFSDGETGLVLGEVADRREDKKALIGDLKDYTRLGHARESVRVWAAQLKELLSTPLTHQVKRDLPFSFLSW